MVLVGFINGKQWRRSWDETWIEHGPSFSPFLFRNAVLRVRFRILRFFEKTPRLETKRPKEKLTLRGARFAGVPASTSRRTPCGPPASTHRRLAQSPAAASNLLAKHGVGTLVIGISCVGIRGRVGRLLSARAQGRVCWLSEKAQEITARIGLFGGVELFFLAMARAAPLAWPEAQVQGRPAFPGLKEEAYSYTKPAYKSEDSVPNLGGDFVES